ncbi:hypothetical protein PoB_003039600 [Plakobranchus ocellatus]|uniref:Serine-threonine/tyrosine-protein kinase catalytic domain-containing protein n=1 Tax=Plakobranchus ocellatus TaxID=259542 RepID=A0AAV4A6J8_9GAST|nr:hypothetical protein PoB_003039600 [Plakobranchus ocellatus]
MESNETPFSFVRYTMMLECWRAIPGQRPEFSELVSRLLDMLDTSTDLVDGYGSRDALEGGAFYSAQNSISSDDGLLLVTQNNDRVSDSNSDEVADTLTPEIEVNSGRDTAEIISDHCPPHLATKPVRNVEQEAPEATALQTTKETSLYVESVSQDSGFEPSPKVSESGSESIAIPLKQTGTIFFGGTDNENPMLASTSFSFRPSVVQEDVAGLDNDVFEADLQDVIPERDQINSGTFQTGPHDRCSSKTPEFRARSRSLITIPERSLCSAPGVSRCWRSDTSLFFPQQALQIQSNRKLTDSACCQQLLTLTMDSSAQTQAVKRERRKAVVTPPTLALDNETYLDCGITLRQLPPPVHIPRRVTGVGVAIDTFSGNVKMTNTGEASYTEDHIQPPSKHNRKSEGKFHRVVAQVHQHQNTKLSQEETLGKTPQSPHKPTAPDPITTAEALSDAATPRPIQGKLVDRGTRKFIRPQDITITNHIEGECLFDGKNLVSNNRSPDLLTRTSAKPQQRKISKPLPKPCVTGQSPSPHMSVSPVRYVHFQFPSRSYKRSLSEDNILASAMESGEFQGLPKTIRSSTLLNDPQAESPSSSIFPWPVECDHAEVSSPTIGRNAAEYIPVRRFSDPSSLPVSFIRQPSQSSSFSYASPSAPTRSSVPTAPGVTQFYIRAAESPSGVTSMHFRWPQEPYEGKKVSWCGCETRIIDTDAGYGCHGDGHARNGKKKILPREKHPIALFQV